MATNSNQRTFKIEQDKWDRFGTWCMMKGSNRTEQIVSFIDSILDETIPEDYEKPIQDRVFKELNKHVTNQMIEDIASRVAIKLRLEMKPVEQVKQVRDILSSKAQKQIKQVEEEKPVEPVEPVEAKTTDTSEKVKNSDPDLADRQRPQKIENSIKDAQTKTELNKSLIKVFPAVANRKGYSDAHVALQVGRTKKTLFNYRTGKYKSPDYFRKSWGLNWSSTEWIKIFDTDD